MRSCIEKDQFDERALHALVFNKTLRVMSYNHSFNVWETHLNLKGQSSDGMINRMHGNTKLTTITDHQLIIVSQLQSTHVRK